jgi:multiple antibiotic resistance protein
MTTAALPLPLLGSLLFILMGPIAVMPLFAATTAGADARLCRHIALRAYFVSLATLGVAVFVGAGAMAGVGTSSSSLIIAAGLILTMTALRNILGTAASTTADHACPPTVALGFMPIAIPGIVTPVGVAVLIIFVSYFPALADKLAIMGIVAAIMTLNLGAMFGARWFMTHVGAAPLLVLGAVFGVLQAAMGVEMLMSGLALSRLMN